MSAPYRSIACGAYDMLEASSMLRRPVRLMLASNPSVEGLVVDVFARGQEEFCRFRPFGATSDLELRLDTIVEIVDVRDGATITTQSC